MDGARRPGAKILVSGGTRCNVTNVMVSEQDFCGGSRAVVRRVLRQFGVAQTVAFFREIGVTLHEEADGKLFPDSGRARDVLDALLREAERCGVERRDHCRVQSISRNDGGFRLPIVGDTDLCATRVVLATGGQSLPKSGSDGAGFAMARTLGHTVVPPVPALVPLLLDSSSPLSHAWLSGISHPAEIAVWVNGKLQVRVQGSLLWTHFGISGPAALDVSRYWTRATEAGDAVRLTLSFCPGASFETLDAHLVAMFTERSRAAVHTLLSTLVPATLAAALLTALGIDGNAVAGAMTREDRRRLVHSLTEWTLPVTGTRGYNYAEVTAGGVTMSEVNPGTLESRIHPGLYFVGEVLDVDGRLGGFNFQWAWSSAYTVATALARVAHTVAHA